MGMMKRWLEEAVLSSETYEDFIQKVEDSGLGRDDAFLKEIWNAMKAPE